MIYGRVIVGTDGSPTAARAVRVAAMVAAADRCELTIVSAYQGASGPAESSLDAASHAVSAIHDRVERRAVALEPAEALVAECGEEGLDLLVVGNKGMTGTSRFLLGSVPDKISHSARSDLLIVSTGTERSGEGPYRKILIATDGSESSVDAAEKGFSLAARFGAKPVVLYAGHPKTAEIVFDEIAKPLRKDVFERMAVAGAPADVIIDVAAQEAFDLIVLGNRGMTQGRFHLGSVPNKVSHHAPCDLLIVKTMSAELSDIAEGQGAVIVVGGDKIAAYRDKSGTVHLMSPRCQHMGCIVAWNQGEATWDCPCHGSRYAATGEVINGPAEKPLAPMQ